MTASATSCWTTLALSWALILAGASGGAIVRGAPGPAVKPTSATSDTAWLVPEAPTPAARYGSFRAAERGLQSIVRKALGARTDSASWTRTREPFWYTDAVKLERSIQGKYFWALDLRDSAITVPTLWMKYEHHSADAPGTAAISAALEAAGWVVTPGYSADGPDGTYFAMVCREALVTIQGSWDGGDDSDTTYVPPPGESVALRCVPRSPGRKRPSFR